MFKAGDVVTIIGQDEVLTLTDVKGEFACVIWFDRLGKFNYENKVPVNLLELYVKNKMRTPR